MTKSPAGRKLTAELKAAVDPIYQRDPVRYARLCQWVWFQQKRNASDESIAQCLKYASNKGLGMHMAANWWSYLNSLMPKASAAAHEAEGQAHKKADMALAGEFVEFLKARRKA